MCGIAGMWGAADEPLLRQMIQKMAHRGPDGQGMHLDAPSSMLGHCRLAIMDPAGGRQPIYSEDRSSVIVANGEIYNYPDLRVALAEQHTFTTNSDSEVILHEIEDQGTAAPQALDGMFAFAASDGESLLVARDPIGIKPLYYGMGDGKHGNTFYFASELKSLVDWADDVHEFPPGTYYHSQQGFVSYYQVPRLDPVDMPLEVRLSQVRQALEKAVAKRMMSDVPVGAFLSGGLDSSILAALVRQNVDELHTFAVGIEGSRDVEAARLVAKHIDSIHHEYIYTPQEVMERLPEVIYHLESFDQDLVRSAIPTYFCSRLAADHVKVILTGEGADELFAGYDYYKGIEDGEALHRELHRSVTALHNINLQRVDRLTMAHGLEGRVPFLDTELVELAQTIPPELKLRTISSGRRVEKWILRKAYEDLLPPEIIWRHKEQFDEGSGTVDILDNLLRSATTGIDTQAYRAAHADAGLRSSEECYYHSLLGSVFSRPQLIVSNVGRWSAPRLAA